MAAIRVFELAKIFGVESRTIQAEILRRGINLPSASSAIPEALVNPLYQHFTGQDSADQ
jgi:hypothetical protein